MSELPEEDAWERFCSRWDVLQHENGELKERIEALEKQIQQLDAQVADLL